jgi:carboxypeptidase Q
MSVSKNIPKSFFSPQVSVFKTISLLSQKINTTNMKSTYLLILVIFITTNLQAQQKPAKEESKAPQTVDIIKKHGLEKSQVMEIASNVCDVYGPRLTGSPKLDEATAWAQTELKKWGMQNVHLEEWGPFGRGWELKHFEMHATTPSYWPVIAYPKAWTPSVSGSGQVIYLDIKVKEDLDKYKGKLSGKFVLMDTIRDVKFPDEAMGTRHDAESLLKLADAGTPTPRPRRGNRADSGSLNNDIWKLIEAEKPIAVLDRSFKGDLGTVFVSGARTGDGQARDNGKVVVPQMTLSVEHYNRIFRLMMKGIPVTLNVDMKAAYTNSDGMEHNILAEIPGTDLKDEVVMFGAHFDSWHTGTGATDNGAGSSVMLEVARILLETIKETGQRPRRTLRLALWTGEEQGLLGSRGYVGKHFAVFDSMGWTPQSLRPDQKTVSAYYNLDNGTGKIRGIFTQGNNDVVPIFREWLQPFHDMGASTVTLSNTGGTDHLPFDGVGIPGFQFIQEPMHYFTRTHHSNMDNWDHLVADDLKQAATIIAHFVWETSQRDQMMPRKELDEDLK